MADWKYRPRAEREAEAARQLTQRQKEEIREETPEGFASRNVKVITFVICLAVLLILIGPVNIFWLRKQKNPAGEVAGAEMTVADVLRISERGENLRLADLEGFAHTVSNSENFTICTISFGPYLLMAVSPSGEQRVQVCTLTHVDSGEEVDVMTGDVDAFLAAHGD